MDKKSMKNGTDLSLVQRVIWDIFMAVKPFLDGENIDYYIIGGTLLGAVRHKGFIPWDDDFDIAIPREHYDRLLAYIGEKLPDHLRLVTYKKDDGNLTHHYYFSRIVDKRYSVKRTGSMVERTENIWIDLFPLDGMPENAAARKLHFLKILSTRAMYHISTLDKVNLKRPGRSINERVIIYLARLTGIWRYLNTDKWLDALDRVLREYPYYDAGWVINGLSIYKEKDMFPKRVFGPGAMYEFEGMKLKGPEDYHFYLSSLFGDYMTPPSGAERNVHCVLYTEERHTEI